MESSRPTLPGKPVPAAPTPSSRPCPTPPSSSSRIGRNLEVILDWQPPSRVRIVSIEALTDGFGRFEVSLTHQPHVTAFP